MLLSRALIIVKALLNRKLKGEKNDGQGEFKKSSP